MPPLIPSPSAITPSNFSSFDCSSGFSPPTDPSKKPSLIDLRREEVGELPRQTRRIRTTKTPQTANLGILSTNALMFMAATASESLARHSHGGHRPSPPECLIPCAV